jgi:hypothetical protein
VKETLGILANNLWWLSWENIILFALDKIIGKLAYTFW